MAVLFQDILDVMSQVFTINDILPALKSGVSLQRRMTYQRSIHLRNELRSVLECCYKKRRGHNLDYNIKNLGEDEP